LLSAENPRFSGCEGWLFAYLDLMQNTIHTKEAARVLGAAEIVVRPMASGGHAWKVIVPSEYTSGRAIPIEGRASTPALAHGCGERAVKALRRAHKCEQ
jgi:hypothetical protein